MKKFYIFAAGMLATFGIQAQTIQFLQNGTPLENGQHIVFNDMEKTADYGDEGFDYKFDPMLQFKCSANGSIDGTMKCLTGQDLQFCLDGSCESKPLIEKTNVPVTAGTVYNTDFEFMGMAWSADVDEVPKDVKADITFMYTGKPETTTTVHFTFNSSTGSVVSVATPGTCVVPMQGEIRYNTETPCLFSLYDMSGHRVLSARVSGNGGIPTAGLTNGFYIYKLGSQTGKIVVK